MRCWSSWIAQWALHRRVPKRTNPRRQLSETDSAWPGDRPTERRFLAKMDRRPPKTQLSREPRPRPWGCAPKARGGGALLWKASAWTRTAKQTRTLVKAPCATGNRRRSTDLSIARLPMPQHCPASKVGLRRQPKGCEHRAPAHLPYALSPQGFVPRSQCTLATYIIGSHFVLEIIDAASGPDAHHSIRPRRRCRVQQRRPHDHPPASRFRLPVRRSQPR